MAIRIFLGGPQGNAYFILGSAVNVLKQMGKESDVDQYLEEAKSGSYKNLLRVTKKYLGDLIEFYEGEMHEYDIVGKPIDISF